MKHLTATALALVCIVLVVALIGVNRSDNAQHETDASAINDLSNTLTAAQTQIAVGNGTMLALSNRFDECRSVDLAFSNQLTEAEAALAVDGEQITNLNRQVTDRESVNQALIRRVMDLTNQMTGLINQIASTRADLNQANKDYAVLENRLRRDVAERLVIERKFNNLQELQIQLWNLQEHPERQISAESIYASLDLEITSNAIHVIAPKRN